MIADAWRARWEHIVPFLSLPADLRRAVYTTNSIENLNRQIRKSIKTRGHFPDEQAATKLIYLAIQRSERKWGARPTTGPPPSEASRSTSETDSPTDMTTVASASHTVRRTVSLRPRSSAAVSTGSARCATAPAATSASQTNSQPVHASTATWDLAAREARHPGAANAETIRPARHLTASPCPMRRSDLRSMHVKPGYDRHQGLL